MAKQACAKRRLLFVDDEQSIRLTLPRFLASFGFEVTVVGTVAEALAAITTKRFDVLVSDLNLPPS
jgi:CheY-like chemotaxis protein